MFQAASKDCMGSCSGEPCYEAIKDHMLPFLKGFGSGGGSPCLNVYGQLNARF